MRKWISLHRRMVTLVVIAALWAAETPFVSLGHGLEDTLCNAVMWAGYAAVPWHFQARRERKAAAGLEA